MATTGRARHDDLDTLDFDMVALGGLTLSAGAGLGRRGTGELMGEEVGERRWWKVLQVGVGVGVIIVFVNHRIVVSVICRRIAGVEALVLSSIFFGARTVGNRRLRDAGWVKRSDTGPWYRRRTRPPLQLGLGLGLGASNNASVLYGSARCGPYLSENCGARDGMIASSTSSSSDSIILPFTTLSEEYVNMVGAHRSLHRRIEDQEEEAGFFEPKPL